MLFEPMFFLLLSVVVLSLVLAPLSSTVAHYIGAIDQPQRRSVHVTAIPRMGGLGMACSIFICLCFFSSMNASILGFLAGLIVIVATGVVDDIWHIRPRTKLICQVIASVVFIEISGEKLSSFGDVFGYGHFVFEGLFEYIITVFCFVGIINAFNLSDGLDGLAAGIVVIICFFLGFIAISAYADDAIMVIITVLGAALGFLKFNSYPARMFMGDTGSLMLGFSLASIMLLLLNVDGIISIKPITIAIILSMPIIDTLWVMFRRILQGNKLSSPDKTHLHHRLLDLGFTHPNVVILLYLWVMLSGFLALLLEPLQEYWQLLCVLSVNAIFYSILYVLEKNKFRAVILRGWLNSLKYFNTQNIIYCFIQKSVMFVPYAIMLGLGLPLLMSNFLLSAFGGVVIISSFVMIMMFFLKFNCKKSNVHMMLMFIGSFLIVFYSKLLSQEMWNIDVYFFCLGIFLFTWSLLQIIILGKISALFISNIELLIVFITCFMSYFILPALGISETIISATKFGFMIAFSFVLLMRLVTERYVIHSRYITICILVMLTLISLKILG